MNSNFEFSIKVLESFLNTGGIAHGGFIATIADTGMGNAAHIIAGNKRCVTINLDIKFISAGKLNEKLIGKVKVSKKKQKLYLFLSLANIYASGENCSNCIRNLENSLTFFP